MKLTKIPDEIEDLFDERCIEIANTLKKRILPPKELPLITFRKDCVICPDLDEVNKTEETK